MATVHSILTNFTAGELSPRLYGRVDLAKYQNGARELTNFVVLPQGGARKRGGTLYVQQVKHADARLEEFTFSTTQAYMLEIGPNYIRFFKDQGAIYDASFDITGITRAATTTIHTAGHTLAPGDPVIIIDTLGSVEFNNREFSVDSVSGNDFDIAVDSTGYGVWSSGGSVKRIYEKSTYYDLADIPGLTFTQSADTLFIFHRQWPIALLTRQSHTNWSLATGNVEEGPFLDMNTVDANTVSLDTASGAAIMTFTQDTLEEAHLGALFRIWEYANGSTFGYATWAPGATVTVADGSYWEYKGNVYYVVSGGGGTMASTASYPTHTRGSATIFYGTSGQSCVMRYEHSGYCVVQVTEVVDTKNAWVNIVKNRTPYTAYGARSSPQWQEGAWSDKNGYVTAGSFHDQRLVVGATDLQPSTLWGSNINAFLKFKDGDKDDESFTYTISSDQVDAIKFMHSTKRLVVLATGAEYIAQATTANEAITPTNIKVSRETSFGTSEVHPVIAGPAILFAQRAGKNENPARKLREFVYNFQTDSYLAPDLTILAEHITVPGIVNGAFTATPDMLIWYARADGALVALTYERDQQVVGWHRHWLGGNGKVVKVAVIPGETSDELWMIVERVIGGQTVRYIEVMQHGLAEGGDVEDAFFVDSGLVYGLGVPTTTVSGLWHLNGQTVSALADGEPVHDLTVSNGKVTLPHSATKITVGYSYTSRLKTLHIEAGAQAGTAQGRIGRVYEIIARLQNAIGGTFGMDETGQMDPIPYREADQPLPDHVEMFNGDKVLPFEGDWDRDRYVTIEHSDPVPFTLTALMISQRVSG